MGTHYIYRGGLTTNDLQFVLAAEPPNFGDQRFVLVVNGELKALSTQQIGEELAVEKNR